MSKNTQTLILPGDNGATYIVEGTIVPKLERIRLLYTLLQCLTDKELETIYNLISKAKGIEE